MNSIITKVKGVTFDDRQVILSMILERYLDGIEIPVRLETEPENQYDPNAVKVLALVEGSEHHIGYIGKDISERVADIIASDQLNHVYMHSIGRAYNGNIGMSIEIVVK